MEGGYQTTIFLTLGYTLLQYIEDRIQNVTPEQFQCAYSTVTNYSTTQLPSTETKLQQTQ